MSIKTKSLRYINPLKRDCIFGGYAFISTFSLANLAKTLSFTVFGNTYDSYSNVRYKKDIKGAKAIRMNNHYVIPVWGKTMLTSG